MDGFSQRAQRFEYFSSEKRVLQYFFVFFIFIFLCFPLFTFILHFLLSFFVFHLVFYSSFFTFNLLLFILNSSLVCIILHYLSCIVYYLLFMNNLFCRLDPVNLNKKNEIFKGKFLLSLRSIAGSGDHFPTMQALEKSWENAFSSFSLADSSGSFKAPIIPMFFNFVNGTL